MDEKIIVSTPLRRSSKIHTRFHIGLLLSLAFLSWVLYRQVACEESPSYSISQIAINRGPSKLKEEFVWTKITPSRQLEYRPCHDEFECARLDVPMDHKSLSSDGSRIAIAIIRYPAPVPIIDPRYAGLILLNPGGPGESGIQFALDWAETLSKNVNPSLNASGDNHPDAKFYDIVSFDPRGVNNTTPQVTCFPDNLSYDLFKLQMEIEGIEAKSNLWARAKALGTGCTENGAEILQHVNTVPVVADMVQIIERHGEWRSSQAKSYINTPTWIQSTTNLSPDHPYSRPSILERTAYKKDQEKLHYWGFSYGTVLGSTFAALEPQRVGRIIIDGVVDLQDYYSTSWLKNLQDTDRIMEKFYLYCSLANSTSCPLNTGSLTASEIRSVVENLIREIKEDPIPVPGTSERAADIITYSDVMGMIKDVFYTPLKLFPRQATLLADLAYGNGSLFAEFKAEQHEQGCSDEDGDTRDCVVPTTMVTPAILCSDGDALDWTKQSFLNHTSKLLNQSIWFGEYWSMIALQCASWNSRAKWNINYNNLTAKTAHPLLIIGNMLDPVTPLRNAFTTQTRFPGSEVLTQNSEGHCTIASPSLCTAKAIRTYFQTGALPVPGTICQPEEIPFLGDNVEVEREFGALSGSDRELLGVVEGMRGVGIELKGLI